MHEAEVQLSHPGTAESLELELTFELAEWGYPHFLIESLFEEEIPGGSGHEAPRNASVEDCQELLNAVDAWMRFTVVGQWEINRNLGRLEIGTPLPTVRRIRYGSPFQIELLLPLLSSAGLTSLFFIARRLYGIDLEFKAYREQRRVEYLEAKAKADLLAVQSPQSPTEGVSTPKGWKLTQGTLRDPAG